MSAFTAALALACSAPDLNEQPDLVTVRDSLGVRIVTYAAGPFDDTISAVPLLTIGQEGQPDYEFFRIRSVVSLASGNVVVANSGTPELRFYGADGRHLRTVGRRGGGPAEFGFLSTLWVRPGDTLAVMDARRRRVVYFDSAGTFARGESYAADLSRLPPEGGCAYPNLMGLLGNGVRLTRGWQCMQLEGRDGKRPILTPIILVRPDRQLNVGVFTTGWIWERGSPTNPRDYYALIPFAGDIKYAIGDESIYLSEGSHLEIMVFDAHGQRSGVLREDSAPPRVTQADRDAYIAERAAAKRPHPEDVPFPERFPSYSRLVLSYEGELWAQRHPRPEDEVQHWVVFSPSGQKIRRVVVPDITVESVRGGRIYGHRSDSLGIQTVVVLDVGH
ncbi:MAG: hypothetical protein IH968_05620 [Gemmatimonadetes bacterium]|nr:hypothetical protein [Gemmatimonadota bacterium]